MFGSKKNTPRKITFSEPVSFELYLPEGQGPFPLVVITPLLGRLILCEDLYLERNFARFFARSGLASTIAHRNIFQFNSSRGLEQLQGYLDQSVERNTKILDHLATFKEVDAQKIGSFGMSFGAIANLLWAAYDQRIRAHVFALGGGNLPEIFISSKDPLMRLYRKQALESSGLNMKELPASLQKIFKHDPLEACHVIPKENVFMCLAIFDRVIQLRYGLELWRGLGKPSTLFIPLGHYSSILAVPFIRGKVLKFLKTKFKI